MNGDWHIALAMIEGTSLEYDGGRGLDVRTAFLFDVGCLRLHGSSHL
jgi:hypothetical protein